MPRSKQRKSRKRHRTKRVQKPRRSEPPKKLSQCIQDFAGDYIRIGETAEKRQSYLNAACSAWTIACAAESQRASLLQKYIKQFRKYNPNCSEQDIANLEEDLETLIENKRKLFPDDKRRIVSAQLYPLKGERDYIAVASART